MIKRILKYIIIYLITIFVFISLLYISTKFPSPKQNYMNSGIYYMTNGEMHSFGKTYGEEAHYVADIYSVAIAYGLRNYTNFNDIMLMSFPITLSMSDLVFKQVKNDLPNVIEYMRYWHGDVFFIRLFHIIGDVNLLYLCNIILLSVLIIALLFLLYKNIGLYSSVIVLLSLIIERVYIVPNCLEYVWVFYIAIITSIILVINRGRCNYLFFIIGMITCYIDFLSTETITLTIPLFILLLYNKNFLSLLKASIQWVCGYVICFLTKIGLCYLCFGKDSIDTIEKDAFYRIFGIVSFKSIEERLFKLQIVPQFENIFLIFIGIFIITLLFLVLRKVLNIQNLLSCIWIAIIPYIRFCVIISHSISHSFMTYRAQISFILVFLLVLFKFIYFWRETLWEYKRKIKVSH